MKTCSVGHENTNDALFCSQCGRPLGSPTRIIEDTSYENLVGQTIGGIYTVEYLIGQGGMATVWHARRRVGDVNGYAQEHPAALKVLNRNFVEQNAAVIKMFIGEAQIISALQDAHIVPIYDYGQDSKTKLVYIGMRELEGVTLDEEVRKKKAFLKADGTSSEDPIPLQRAVSIMCQALEAMVRVHEYRPSNPIVHRDLKPSNLMLTKSGAGKDHIYLLDFGIAQFREATGPDGQTFMATSEKMIMGTYPYMSPEHWNKQFCPGSDIFCLGVILYELITGRKPFGGDDGEDDVTILNNIIHLPHPPLDLGTLSGLRQNDLERILAQALAKDPKDRYQSCREFLTALEKFDLPPASRQSLRKVFWILALTAGFVGFTALGYYLAESILF
jgi:serine/threonine-protein kinase